MIWPRSAVVFEMFNVLKIMRSNHVMVSEVPNGPTSKRKNRISVRQNMFFRISGSTIIL